MQKNIVFFGSGWFVIPVVKKLMDRGLGLVVTNDKNPESALLKFCSENDIPTLVVSTTSDLISHISSVTNYQTAILASFGVIIPNEILGLFPNGIINIHPSLLPKWKGPSPIQYSLLNGDQQTGVTLIRLDNEVDHGPILSQKPYNLLGDETSQDLLSILFEIGSDMVDEIVTKIGNGQKISETPQDHNKETWSYKITKQDGKIDLLKIPSSDSEIRYLKLEIARKVRAFYPWPSVWFNWYKLNGQTKIVKLLPENRIQVEGKNPMNYKDFINGFGEEGKQLLQKLQLL